ncbi:hypothetical protein B0H63DRAFT_528803 [Podospora didyma]|uniref:Uncharacterized protein n=1 Tax=Podospora didyma TaxID=330526 RepID=A0AAE0K1M9_9PEZI|nr:hypothetical protein B0H63DRAFT_528803 [Podospora didyma]
MLQQRLNLVFNMSVALLIIITLATQLRTSAGSTGVALTATAALSMLRGFEDTVLSEDDHMNYDGSNIPKD